MMTGQSDDLLVDSSILIAVKLSFFDLIQFTFSESFCSVHRSVSLFYPKMGNRQMDIRIAQATDTKIHEKRRILMRVGKSINHSETGEACKTGRFCQPN
jgi:hypothetical protein